MPKKSPENQKHTSCHYKTRLIGWRRRRERPDFFHKCEAHRNILVISRIKQVCDAMTRYFVCLKVEAEERGGDDETIDHDARLVDSEVSTALHNVLGILVSCYVVVANQEVHEAEVAQKHEEFRVGIKESEVGERGKSSTSTTFSI
jgi:hypothetical protein